MSCGAPWCSEYYCQVVDGWRYVCRCQGKYGDCHCERPASQEDGYCDGCRTHGGCEYDVNDPRRLAYWADRPWARDPGLPA